MQHRGFDPLPNHPDEGLSPELTQVLTPLLTLLDVSVNGELVCARIQASHGFKTSWHVLDWWMPVTKTHSELFTKTEFDYFYRWRRQTKRQTSHKYKENHKEMLNQRHLAGNTRQRIVLMKNSSESLRFDIYLSAWLKVFKWPISKFHSTGSAHIMIFGL